MVSSNSQNQTSSHVLESDEFTLPGWELVGVTASGERLPAVTVGSKTLQIGRRADADIVVFDPTVSQFHAEIFCSDGKLLVRDLKSTNGTHLNGDRISSPVPVADGDQIYVGNFMIEVHAGGGDLSTQSLESETIVSLEHWFEDTFTQLLETGGLHALFQPIINLKTLRPMGFEAFIRSRIPGLESPYELFQLAKKKSVAVELSQICRTVAAEEASELPAESTIFLKMNNSELLDETLLDSLQKLRANAEGMSFVIQLDEDCLTEPKRLLEFQVALDKLKIDLAFDDFGAGRSRLQELLIIQPTYVKFDQSLIRESDLLGPQRKLVQSLVESVRSLGIRTIAEGIESHTALEICRDIGFELGQGYAIGTPAPAKRWTS